MAKMTDRELTRLALLDALSWRSTLCEANGEDTGAGKLAALRAGQYRELLVRKYGGIPEDAVRERRINAKALASGIRRVDL